MVWKQRASCELHARGFVEVDTCRFGCGFHSSLSLLFLKFIYLLQTYSDKCLHCGIIFLSLATIKKERLKAYSVLTVN